mmetsp:Transcript_27417/g.58662  ORF Transcript_27417/g.58662 Transcript_27417/m.58662 type:complete len:203 (-) Transcript_27417:281-889(-)
MNLFLVMFLLFDLKNVASDGGSEFIPCERIIPVRVNSVEALSDGCHIGSSEELGHDFLLLKHLVSPFGSGDLAIAVLVEGVEEFLELDLTFFGLEGLLQLLEGLVGFDFGSEFVPCQLAITVAVDAVETRSNFCHGGSSEVLGHDCLLFPDLLSPFGTADLSVTVLVESVPEFLELGLSFIRGEGGYKLGSNRQIHSVFLRS